MLDKERLLEILREVGVPEELIGKVILMIEDNKEEIFDEDLEEDFE